MKRFEKVLTTAAILYFFIGFVFAIAFAIYYRWPPVSFLSPGFFTVVITWPFQAIGFTGDLLRYGFAGKPI